MMYVVRISTDKESADPEYREESGQDCLGPYSQKEAESVAKIIEAYYVTIPETHFVYGLPTVEVRPLRYELTKADIEKTAANWHYDPESEV